MNKIMRSLLIATSCAALTPAAFAEINCSQFYTKTPSQFNQLLQRAPNKVSQEVNACMQQNPCSEASNQAQCMQRLSEYNGISAAYTVQQQAAQQRADLQNLLKQSATPHNNHSNQPISAQQQNSQSSSQQTHSAPTENSHYNFTYKPPFSRSQDYSNKNIYIAPNPYNEQNQTEQARSQNNNTQDVYKNINF